MLVMVGGMFGIIGSGVASTGTRMLDRPYARPPSSVSRLFPSRREADALTVAFWLCEFPVVSRRPHLAWAFHSTALTSSALPNSNFGSVCANTIVGRNKTAPTTMRATDLFEAWRLHCTG